MWGVWAHLWHVQGHGACVNTLPDTLVASTGRMYAYAGAGVRVSPPNAYVALATHLIVVWPPPVWDGGAWKRSSCYGLRRTLLRPY